MENWDYLIKLLVVGPSKSGKSSLIRKFMMDEGTNNPSNNQDFFVKNIVSLYTSKVVRLQIFEHARSSGNESMYRGIDGVVITYECTDSDPQQTIGGYLDLIRRYSPDNVNTLLVATKTDLKSDTTKLTNQLDIVDIQSIQYAETSAKENVGVDEAFFEIIKSVEHEFNKRRNLYQQSIDI